MKKMVYGGIGAAIALVIILMLRSAAFDATPGTDFAYHTLLSGTDDYKSGIYTENFDLTAGDYAIRFVWLAESVQMQSSISANQYFTQRRSLDPID